MHRKRKVISVLALICMVGAVIYGSRLEMAGTGEGLSGLSLFNRKETIHFWYSDEGLSDFINSAAVAFGEEHNARVIPQLVSESEYLEAVNEATLHSEQMPDVFQISNDSLEKAYLAGLAGEIRDEQGACSEEHFPKAALSAVTYHGRKVGYPFYYDTTVLVYNRTYLQEWLRQQEEKANVVEEDLEDMEPSEDGDGGGDVIDEELSDEELALRETRITQLLSSGIPQTVDDILYIGDTFDLPEGVEGIMKWDVSDIFYNYWITGNYMIIGGDTGDSREAVDLDNAETLACLEIYKGLNQFFSIESDSITYDSAVQDFIDGKIVFTIASTDVLRTLDEAQEQGRLTCEYGVTVMPEMSDLLDSRAMSVTSVIAVNGYSEEKELANQFAAFLTGSGSEDLYAKTGRMAASLDAKREDARHATFMESYATSIPMPKMIETSNFWIQMEVLFSRVWNGGDVAQLLSELSEQIQVQLGNAGS